MPSFGGYMLPIPPFRGTRNNHLYLGWTIACAGKGITLDLSKASRWTSNLAWRGDDLLPFRPLAEGRWPEDFRFVFFRNEKKRLKHGVISEGRINAIDVDNFVADFAQGSLNATHLGGGDQTWCKCMILKGFPFIVHCLGWWYNYPRCFLLWRIFFGALFL